MTPSHQGPRMVRDVFRLAKENAPSIIFIDEVDAIATARFDAQTGEQQAAGGVAARLTRKQVRSSRGCDRRRHSQAFCSGWERVPVLGCLAAGCSCCCCAQLPLSI